MEMFYAAWFTEDGRLYLSEPFNTFDAAYSHYCGNPHTFCEEELIGMRWRGVVTVEQLTEYLNATR